MKASKQRPVLYCFSPPVMVATCVIEVTLAAYAWFRYRPTAARNLVVVSLAMLAVFQLAEYFVCGGLGMSALAWSRVGYVAITLLPPLGLHLIAKLSGRPHRLALITAYGAAAVLVAFFALAPTSVNREVCAGNYVIFHLRGLADAWYGGYYYGVILVALMAAAGGIQAAADRRIQQALRWYIAGVLAFLIPTATVNALDPRTLAGIPSIMCGFAILYALVLALRVLPLAGGGPNHLSKAAP